MGEVLVVDDSKTMRMIVGKILRELGLTVSEAVDGKDALRVLETRLDVVTTVLTDWNMPQMNGLELVKELRRNPKLSSLVVIMVTTETEMINVAAALEAGANEYIMKPFTRDVLEEKLKLVGILPLAER